MAIATPDGEFLASYSERGLCALDFPTRSGAAPGSVQAPNSVPPNVREWHAVTSSAVRRVLEGTRPKALPPLDMSAGTAFQRGVWELLCTIEPGETASYGDIARRLGRPNATRAVGGACGANPIPVLVPCHRVLAANRKLGGFSGGLPWKEKLLAREGVTLNLPSKATIDGEAA